MFFGKVFAMGSAMLLMAHTAAHEASPPLLDRRFDQVAWLTTHNSFNVGTGGNQDQSISRQLADGVRGLMIDIYDQDGRAVVRHTRVTRGEFLADLLNREVIPFLQLTPDAVVTIFLDDHVSAEVLNRELDNSLGLAPLVFDPDTWDTAEWPTLRDMIDRGQRLLIFSYELDHPTARRYNTPEGAVRVMASTAGTVENYWSLGLTRFSHDYSCVSRWKPGLPLTTANVSWQGKAWSRVFVMNHFHGISLLSDAHHDNRLNTLTERLNDYCYPAAGRKPNFVALDYYNLGDGMRFVEGINNGNIDPGK
ncbi:chitinase [Luteibacter sp. Sphag1AF]|uniref:hypothetical protein n=1 Tax=Luteibacter sp. Sphag1AF TaxID=2587031 RepID=UPI001618CD3F|nr:hypothetical protein [Luteibacter sp. Sphag1AF]MBB3226306.1 chitinase [Luteibacter sp. Sphag1AF]